MLFISYRQHWIKIFLNALLAHKHLFMVTARALTNTVGGEYECIHDYRATNMNAKYSYNASWFSLIWKDLLERSENQNAVLPYKDRNGPQAQRYQAVYK